MAKVVLVVLDGLGYSYSRRLLGNVEGWVANGEAKVWRMQSVLPSTSGPCYASIHTGVEPQIHGIRTNADSFRLEQPDIFSAARAAGRTTAAVAHSYFSAYFQRAPFDPLMDLEVDDETLPIQHGRFYTMEGEFSGNLAVPSDADIFAQTSILMRRHAPDYILLHSCTTDSIGHAFGSDSIEMDKAAYLVDGVISRYLPMWRDQGYEVMITADHGQSGRGHHGGTDDIMRDVALYYFGAGDGPLDDAVLDQRAIAPAVLGRLGAEIPASMAVAPFISPDW